MREIEQMSTEELFALRYQYDALESDDHYRLVEASKDELYRRHRLLMDVVETARAIDSAEAEVHPFFAHLMKTLHTQLAQITWTEPTETGR